MKKIFLSLFIIVVLVILGTVIYVSVDYLRDKNSLQFTPIIGNDIDNKVEENSTSTDIVATSTLDTSSWKVYSNEELGYELKYPQELIMNSGNMTLILAFPKKTFFHWPLEDSIKLTVVASSSCNNDLFKEFGVISTSTLKVNGQIFSVYKVTDIATGNIYEKHSYNIEGEGRCYSIIYDLKGTNGAGFFVSDPIMIKKYDEQHAIDIKAVKDVVYSILGTFNIIKSREGQIEGQLE